MRGLNNKSRRDSVCSLVAALRPDIVCLQETKKEEISRWMVLSTLGIDFDEFAVLPAIGTRGGVLVAWKGRSCKNLGMRVDRFSVYVRFDHDEGLPLVVHRSLWSSSGCAEDSVFAGVA